jgi:hypothetical protein
MQRRVGFCAGFFKQRGKRMEVKLNSKKMGITPSASLNNRRMFARVGLVCVVLWALSGCAVLQPEDGDKWRQSQHPELKDRAEKRWGALIKGDFETAYTFSSPDFRAVVSLQQYRSKFGRALSWRLARVVNVSYDEPTVATVSVEVAYRTSLPGIVGEMIETQSLISEKWVYKNRQWWYTAN